MDFENTTFKDISYSDNGDFAPCSSEEIKLFDQHFVPVFYSLLFTFGMLGNGLVMVVMLCTKQKLQSTDMFILHLAVADILLAVTLPFWAVQATVGWIFSEALCKIVASIFKINFYAGTFLLACISCDRYLSIVFAVQIYKKKRVNLVHWSCLGVWSLCTLLCIPDLMYYTVTFESRTNMTECQAYFPPDTIMTWKASIAFLYHIFGFLLPLIGMLFCYFHIVATLLKSQGFKRHRALRLIIAVVVAFFLCWTPYNIVAFMDTIRMLGGLESKCASLQSTDIALSITSGLCYLHSCLNPLLYVFIGAKFRNNLAELLSRKSLCPRLVAHVYRRRPSSTKSFTWSESGDTSLSGVY